MIWLLDNKFIDSRPPFIEPFTVSHFSFPFSISPPSGIFPSFILVSSPHFEISATRSTLLIAQLKHESGQGGWESSALLTRPINTSITRITELNYFLTFPSAFGFLLRRADEPKKKYYSAVMLRLDSDLWEARERKRKRGEKRICSGKPMFQCFSSPRHACRPLVFVFLAFRATDLPVEHFKQKSAQLIITAVIIVREAPFSRLRVGPPRPRESLVSFPILPSRADC